MGRTPISEPCLFCLKLGLIPNLYMIFGITIPKNIVNFGIRALFQRFSPTFSLSHRDSISFENGY